MRRLRGQAFPLSWAAFCLAGPLLAAGPRVAEVPPAQYPVEGRAPAGLGAGPILAPALLPTASFSLPVGPVPLLAAPIAPAFPAVQEPPSDGGLPSVPRDADSSPEDRASETEAFAGTLERAAEGAAVFDGAFVRDEAIPSEIILDSGFRERLGKIEALVPKDLLESPGPLAAQRRDLESGFERMKAAREEFRRDLVRTRPDLSPARAALSAREKAERDPESLAARERVLRAGRRLLASYDASLPPGERLDFSSAETFADSVEWSARLRRTGAGAFPFRSGPAAWDAALAVREALRAELPQLARPEFEGVARAIGVLVMRDGTVHVAFSGTPEVLRVVVGGAEAALEARLNGPGRRRFRVLPADAPVPEGLERAPGAEERSADNRFCAEKKLFSVLRDNPALRAEVAQWAVLWRGDARRNSYGTRRLPAFMAPCPHCVHNARRILEGPFAAARRPR